jgi:hypothetical protein
MLDGQRKAFAVGVECGLWLAEIEEDRAQQGERIRRASFAVLRAPDFEALLETIARLIQLPKPVVLDP